MLTMILRVELVLDKPREDLSRAHAVLEPHVVVVQKNRKQPHVVARRFRLLVDRVTYFARRIGADAGVLGHVDELERLDRLRFPVFRDFEVFLLQIVDGVALPVGDDDVHADEVDVGAEDRGLRVCSAGAAGGGAGC